MSEVDHVGQQSIALVQIDQRYLMIIEYPTGLYRTYFGWEDSEPEDKVVLNASWYISSNTPPRIRDYFDQLKTATQKYLPQRVYDRDTRRLDVGSLIFTTKTVNTKDVGDGKKQFEEGQMLEFEDIQTIGVNDIAVSNVMSVRHDTNVLSLDEYVDADDADDLESKATAKLRELNEQFNYYRSIVFDMELKISKYQKSINEINKAITAVGVLGSDTGGVLTTLQEKLEEYKTLLDEAVTAHRENNELADQIRDDIRNISQLVR